MISIDMNIVLCCYDWIFNQMQSREPWETLIYYDYEYPDKDSYCLRDWISDHVSSSAIVRVEYFSKLSKKESNMVVKIFTL